MLIQCWPRHLTFLSCALLMAFFMLAGCRPVQRVTPPAAVPEAQTAGVAGATELSVPEAPAGAEARTPGASTAKTPEEDGATGAPANNAPEVGTSPALTPEERLARCFELTPAAAEAVLGEPVTPAWSIDTSYGYCVYAGVADNDGTGQDDLLPVYGPVGEHRYLAVNVWPVGAATDPLMYLAFAILDREHARLSEFLQEFSGVAGLEELARVESRLPNLEKEFLPDVGDGALWYWQETSSGDHLAGLYGIAGSQRIAVQALIGPERSAAEVRAALAGLVADLTTSE